MKTLKPSDQALWASTLVSTVHAILIVYMAVTAATSSGIYREEDFLFTTPETYKTFYVFVSYITYDAFVCIVYRNEWPGMLANAFHHSASIISFVHLIHLGYGHQMGLAAITMEASTPFINLRWFLEASGTRKTQPTLYLVNGGLMTLVWFIIRVLWPSLSVYLFLFVQFDQLYAVGISATAVLLGTSLVGYFLQIFWFTKIVKGILKAISGPVAPSYEKKKE